MAIAFRAAQGSNNAGGGATITMTVPSGVVNGDVMVMHISTRAGQTPDPSGWTLVVNGFYGATINQSCWWRVASSEPASYSVTLQASAKASGVIIALSGADSTAPASAQYAGQANSPSVSCPAPALGSWSSANGIDLYVCGTAVGTTAGTPTNYTAGASSASTGGSAASRTTSGTSYRSLTAVTTVGSITADFGASAGNVGQHVFIKEASSGTTYFQTAAATTTLTPAMTRLNRWAKTVAAAMTATVSVSRVAAYLKTVTITLAAAVSISRIASYFRTVAVTTALALTLTKRTFVTVAIASVHAISVTKGLLYLRTVAVASTLTISVVSTKVKLISVAAVSTLTPAISRVSSFLRTVAVSSGFTVGLTRIASYLKTVAVSSAFTIGISRGGSYLKTISVSNAWAASISKNGYVVVSAVSSFSISLTKMATYRKIVAVTSGFVTSVTRTFIQAPVAAIPRMLRLAARFLTIDLQERMLRRNLTLADRTYRLSLPDRGTALELTTRRFMLNIGDR